MIDWLTDLKKWNKINNVKQNNKSYDLVEANKQMEEIFDKKPYRSDPKYFKKVKISVMALIKMLSHTQLGGSIEVMGLFQGSYNKKGEFIVMDSIALPVEATQTRVNAGAQADKFIVDHSELCQKIGSFSSIGWYHSHPTYGCWLSGIDVNTQINYQKINDPWLAIVIDPIRTITREKIQIGAFRTFPENYVVKVDNEQLNNDIPMKKIADFGVHYNRYYQLEVQFFQNETDTNIIETLWKKYWVGNLSNSPFYNNIDYFTENIEQVKVCCQQLCRREHITLYQQGSKKKEANLKKVINLTLEKNQALLGEAIKNLLF